MALGPTLARVLLSKSVPLVEGVCGMMVLLQWALARLSVRFEPVSALVKSEPSLVLRDGTFLNGALRQQRLTRGKIMAALRESGVADASGAVAVILENDGSFSVIKV